MKRSLAGFRNRRGERIEPASFTATEVKNEFGRVLDTVARDGVAVITRHDAPKAVIVAMDEFDALVRPPKSQLDTLSGEFDALLTRMQLPAATAAMKNAFGASPEKLGKAAVAAARRRG